MDFIVKLTTGGQFEVNESEAKIIAQAPDSKSITLPRLGIVIQKRMITLIPKSLADDVKDRREQEIGCLHDGTLVKRHFGQWVISNSSVPDDTGRFVPVVPDPEYYPEIRIDKVATLQEYQKIKASNADYYKFLEIEKGAPRLSSGTPQSIGSILNQKRLN